VLGTHLPTAPLAIAQSLAEVCEPDIVGPKMQRTAAAIREGRFKDVDVENVSEEIEALARGDKRELRSRLATLMMHLLKLEYRPEKATPSWRVTIFEQATSIAELLQESPSLRPAFNDSLATS
jgi:hypothetical protein